MKKHELALWAFQLVPLVLHFQDGSQLACKRDGPWLVILRCSRIQDNLIFAEAYLRPEQRKDLRLAHSGEIAHGKNRFQIVGKSIAHQSVLIVDQKSLSDVVLLEHWKMWNEPKAAVLFGEIEHT